jgi:hypothetical protein
MRLMFPVEYLMAPKEESQGKTKNKPKYKNCKEFCMDLPPSPPPHPQRKKNEYLAKETQIVTKLGPVCTLAD